MCRPPTKNYGALLLAHLPVAVGLDGVTVLTEQSELQMTFELLIYYSHQFSIKNQQSMAIISVRMSVSTFTIKLLTNANHQPR